MSAGTSPFGLPRPYHRRHDCCHHHQQQQHSGDAVHASPAAATTAAATSAAAAVAAAEGTAGMDDLAGRLYASQAHKVGFFWRQYETDSRRHELYGDGSAGGYNLNISGAMLGARQELRRRRPEEQHLVFVEYVLADLLQNVVDAVSLLALSCATVEQLERVRPCLDGADAHLVLLREGLLHVSEWRQIMPGFEGLQVCISDGSAAGGGGAQQLIPVVYVFLQTEAEGARRTLFTAQLFQPMLCRTHLVNNSSTKTGGTGSIEHVASGETVHMSVGGRFGRGLKEIAREIAEHPAATLTMAGSVDGGWILWDFVHDSTSVVVNGVGGAAEPPGVIQGIVGLCDDHGSPFVVVQDKCDMLWQALQLEGPLATAMGMQAVRGAHVLFSGLDRHAHAPLWRAPGGIVAYARPRHILDTGALFIDGQRAPRCHELLEGDEYVFVVSTSQNSPTSFVEGSRMSIMQHQLKAYVVFCIELLLVEDKDAAVQFFCATVLGEPDSMQAIWPHGIPSFFHDLPWYNAARDILRQGLILLVKETSKIYELAPDLQAQAKAKIVRYTPDVSARAAGLVPETDESGLVRVLLSTGTPHVPIEQARPRSAHRHVATSNWLDAMVASAHASGLPVRDVSLYVFERVENAFPFAMAHPTEPDVAQLGERGHRNGLAAAGRVASVDTTTYYVTHRMHVLMHNLVNNRPLSEQGGGRVENADEDQLSDLVSEFLASMIRALLIPGTGYDEALKRIWVRDALKAVFKPGHVFRGFSVLPPEADDHQHRRDSRGFVTMTRAVQRHDNFNQPPPAPSTPQPKDYVDPATGGDDGAASGARADSTSTMPGPLPHIRRGAGGGTATNSSTFPPELDPDDGRGKAYEAPSGQSVRAANHVHVPALHRLSASDPAETGAPPPTSYPAGDRESAPPPSGWQLCDGSVPWPGLHPAASDVQKQYQSRVLAAWNEGLAEMDSANAYTPAVLFGEDFAPKSTDTYDDAIAERARGFAKALVHIMQNLTPRVAQPLNELVARGGIQLCIAPSADAYGRYLPPHGCVQLNCGHEDSPFGGTFNTLAHELAHHASFRNHGPELGRGHGSCWQGEFFLLSIACPEPNW